MGLQKDGSYHKTKVPIPKPPAINLLILQGSDRRFEFSVESVQTSFEQNPVDLSMRNHQWRIGSGLLSERELEVTCWVPHFVHLPLLFRETMVMKLNYYCNASREILMIEGEVRILEYQPLELNLSAADNRIIINLVAAGAWTTKVIPQKQLT